MLLMGVHAQSTQRPVGESMLGRRLTIMTQHPSSAGWECVFLSQSNQSATNLVPMFSSYTSNNLEGLSASKTQNIWSLLYLAWSNHPFRCWFIADLICWDCSSSSWSNGEGNGERFVWTRVTPTECFLTLIFFFPFDRLEQWHRSTTTLNNSHATL